MTEAKTYWMIKTKSGDQLTLETAQTWKLIRIVYSTANIKKTHWFVYVEILNPNEIKEFVRIRISNRGNINTQFYPINQMTKFKIPIEEAKKINLIDP